MRTAAMLTLLLTACQPGGNGNPDPDPDPCADPAATGNGEPCATDDDCTCGNACIADRCVILAALADGGIDPDPEPDPDPPAMPDPNADPICRQLDALPCIDASFTLDRCVEVWNLARSLAVADGCTAVYDTLSTCQARGAICPEADDFYWPDCADELEALDQCQCGDDATTPICLAETPDACRVGGYDGCDLGAEAHCHTAGDHRECTCVIGATPGLVFAVPLAAAPDCCELTSLVIDTCGEGLRPVN